MSRSNGSASDIAANIMKVMNQGFWNSCGHVSCHDSLGEICSLASGEPPSMGTYWSIRVRLPAELPRIHQTLDEQILSVNTGRAAHSCPTTPESLLLPLSVRPRHVESLGAPAPPPLSVCFLRFASPLSPRPGPLPLAPCPLPLASGPLLLASCPSLALSLSPSLSHAYCLLVTVLFCLVCCPYLLSICSCMQKLMRQYLIVLAAPLGYCCGTRVRPATIFMVMVFNEPQIRSIMT